MLVGLPSIFFTTTKHSKTYNGLPDQSPYPSHGIAGQEHWRLSLPLDRFKDYDIWYCKHPAKNSNLMYQVRLLLTTKNSRRKPIPEQNEQKIADDIESLDLNLFPDPEDTVIV